MRFIHSLPRFFLFCGLLLFISNPAFPQISPDAPTEAQLNNLSRQAFERINQRRIEIGLPPFVLNNELQVSASAHASYIVMNDSLSSEMHYETAGKIGFTGQDPDNRIKQAGYISNGTAENIAMTNYPDGAVASDNLIDAPYHRLAEFSTYVEAGNSMKAKVATAGSGNNHEYIYVINFGNPASTDAPNKIITYPTAEQKNTKIDWIVNEVPSPWPENDGKRVGYPISIGVGPLLDLEVQAFSLIEVSARSSPLTGRLVTTENGKLMKNFAFWIPSKPLNFNAKYQAHVVGLINGKRLDYKWQFSTLAKTPLMLTVASMRLDKKPGSSMLIRMSGGTNNDYKINEITQSWQVMGDASIAKTSFVNMTNPSPDIALIYRNATPCEGSVTACVAKISGSDSSGAKASIDLIID